MGLDPLEKLWSEWLQDKLENERAIGQMLQHLMILRSEVDRLKRQRGKETDQDKEA
jgi:hypothetical protein